MGDASTLTPPLISPAAARRTVPVLPSWFLGDPIGRARGGRVFNLLLSDSHGENLEDLLAAWCLRTNHRGTARAIVLDDQRDPDLCVQSLYEMFTSGFCPDAAIGHFSSPVARQAARVYAAQDVPFFAPGSSADDLATQPGSSVFQLFARDSGQVAVIAAALNKVRGAVLLGQPRNAGSTLRALLQAALQRPWQSYDHVSEASGSLVRNKPLVILGSKEYAAEIMSALGKDNRPSIIYLSDDSLGAVNVQHEARRLATPVFVAALKRSEGQTGLPDHTTDKLERNAVRILGRPPGPYFLTSWFAIHFALKGLGQGTRTSAELLTSLQSQPWKTVYGPIRFDNFGRAEGFTWELKSMS